jgi:L,D-transpeptidase catalytic domain
MKLTVPFFMPYIFLSFVLSISNPAGGNSFRSNPGTISTTHNKSNSITPYKYEDKNAVLRFYDSLQLDCYGLSKQAWVYACKGYEKLLKKGTISNPDIITICDFSLSSRRKRLFIINLKEGELVLDTYVAHGRKSGTEYARKFSNKASSHQSSLGFYVTGNTYYGDNGLSLRMEGLDAGFNDNALRRNIVIHGCEYVGDDFIQGNSFMGRSFGCPAVPEEQIANIVNTIKKGSCFFIYYPEKKYLTKSKILNG